MKKSKATKTTPITPPSSRLIIGPGHLVIAQESHENGWWEAICIKRDGDMLTLRFRDYPKLPRFSRHRAAVALISTALGVPSVASP